MRDTKVMEDESVNEIEEQSEQQQNPEQTTDGMPKRYQRRNFVLLLMMAGIFPEDVTQTNTYLSVMTVTDYNDSIS